MHRLNMPTNAKKVGPAIERLHSHHMSHSSFLFLFTSFYFFVSFSAFLFLFFYCVLHWEKNILNWIAFIKLSYFHIKKRNSSAERPKLAVAQMLLCRTLIELM